MIEYTFKNYCKLHGLDWHEDQELINSGNYICGGNHEKYLSTYNINIEVLK